MLATDSLKASRRPRFPYMFESSFELTIRLAILYMTSMQQLLDLSVSHKIAQYFDENNNSNSEINTDINHNQTKSEKRNHALSFASIQAMHVAFEQHNYHEQIHCNKNELDLVRELRNKSLKKNSHWVVINSNRYA